MAKLGSLIFMDDIEQSVNSIKSTSDLLHSNILNAFSDSNVLYNMSSVMEDIVLDKYLSMYNTAKAINIGNILKNNVIIESFTSNDFNDLEFPVDEYLNIDTQNGDLSLPIQSTKSLDVSSVILGSESNGNLGNSLENNKNNDVTAMLNGNSTSMLEYEIVSNSWKVPTLRLSVTLRLASENVANGVYIKTFAEDGMLYPKIESILVSLDGELWINAPRVVDVNKADYYIRFKSQRARFVKVLFSQTTYHVVKSIFGNKNRYMIGVREISIKQTTYKSTGEYISRAFTSSSTINTIAFRSQEESNRDISYFISADNGSRWVRIKSGQLLQLSNANMGLRGDIDVSAVRIKILMNRNLLPNTKTSTEWINTNSSNKYSLTHQPADISTVEAWVGGHITCGDDHPYNVSINDTANIDKEVLETSRCIIDKNVNFASVLKFIPYHEDIEKDIIVKMNGLILKNSRNTYNIIRHANPLNSIVIFNNKAFLSNSVPASQLSLEYAPYLHDNRTQQVPTITLPATRPAFIPSGDGVSVIALKYSDIEVITPSHMNIFDSLGETYSVIENKSDVDGMSCWLIESGNIGEPVCPKQYTFSPHFNAASGDYSYNPSAWLFEGSNDGIKWTTIQEESLTNPEWNGSLKAFKTDNDCYFCYFRWRFTQNSSATNLTTLNLAGINLYEGELEKLESSSFKVIDRYTIKIDNSSYSIDWDYLVYYTPAVNIDNYVPNNVDLNRIELQGLPTLPNGIKVCFEYEYQDNESNEGKVFYTPICNEYKVELL